MNDDRIKAVFEEYGRIVTGKEYALIHAIAEAVAPQRTWVGLTDEEKQEWIDAMPYDPQPRHCMTLVNIIESKLKEKNT